MYTTTPYARNRRPGQRFTRSERRAMKKMFLRDFIEHQGLECPSVTRSCRAVGISRGTFYYWMRTDPIFCKKVTAINEIWYGDDRALQRYGKELCRRVSPAAGKEAKRRIIATAYIRAYQETTTSSSPPDFVDSPPPQCDELDEMLEMIKQEATLLPMALECDSTQSPG